MNAKLQTADNGLQTMNKPSNLKSLQTLRTFQQKFEENKGSLHLQRTAPTNCLNTRIKTEELATDRPVVKPAERMGHVHKKFSAQLDPSTIPPPRKEGHTDLRLAESHSTKSGSAVLSKEQLRTTFTASTFSQKPALDKEAMRKTTLNAPFRFFDPKNSHPTPEQPETNSPSKTFKKQLPEKRIEIPQNESLRLPSQVLSPTALKRKSPVVGGFMLGKCLGSGKFGQVHLAKHISTGFICALKKIVKSKAKQLNMMAQLIQQIKLHAYVNHPTIVQFYGCFSDQLNVYLILEYMEGGTLFDYMNQYEKLSETETVNFVREVTTAVKYLHDVNIAHRDIKPENIVISYGIAKLCDFGWSARVQGSRKTYCGTFDYAPPEILERKEYDLSVDLWCLGVLTYELLTGKVPFEHEERRIVMQKIVNVDKDRIIYPADMSPNAKDFIQNLVKKIPNQRMKSYKLLSHPFLAESKCNN